MIINHNIAALNTHRQLTGNQNAVQGSLEKLSSGLQINKAGDDAAGLAISEKMRGQIRGLEMAEKNAQDGISLIQTAEGAMNESHAILQRMRELATQSANDTNTDADRAELQKEVDQLANALNDISEDTEFNTQSLLDGSFEGTFHIGANEGQNLSVEIGDMSAEALGVVGVESTEATIASNYVVTNSNGEEINIEFADLETGTEETEGSHTFNEENNTLTITLAQDAGADASSPGAISSTHNDVLAAINSVSGLNATLADSVADGSAEIGGTTVPADGNVSAATTPDPDKGINISTQSAADNAITTIQSAIDQVSAERSKLGAVQNRLDHTINNLGTSAENLTAAESRIRDVDMAKEMMEFTKNNILSQAAQSMLAQANQQPQGVLQLLQ
ncbi:flagellin [Lentibacillus sediminis]|uniref:flagellin N-terminal helical domain-containing protein n=1 Tax=Lentibacillus sediminis TaxID=1940529 RepID=UPI000C1BBB09|nr:flagellin [Lentibacillus sediminis]